MNVRLLLRYSGACFDMFFLVSFCDSYRYHKRKRKPDFTNIKHETALQTTEKIIMADVISNDKTKTVNFNKSETIDLGQCCEKLTEKEKYKEILITKTKEKNARKGGFQERGTNKCFQEEGIEMNYAIFHSGLINLSGRWRSGVLRISATHINQPMFSTSFERYRLSSAALGLVTCTTDLLYYTSDFCHYYVVAIHIDG